MEYIDQGGDGEIDLNNDDDVIDQGLSLEDGDQ